MLKVESVSKYQVESEIFQTVAAIYTPYRLPLFTNVSTRYTRQEVPSKLPKIILPEQTESINANSIITTAVSISHLLDIRISN
jgi:hypothetical protein